MKSQKGVYQLYLLPLGPAADGQRDKAVFLRREGQTGGDLSRGEADLHRPPSLSLPGRDDDFPVRESALCDYCPYFELCPAKRHRRAIEDESADVLDPKTGKVTTIWQNENNSGGIDGLLDKPSEVCLRGNKVYVANIDLTLDGNEHNAPHTISVIEIAE